MPDYTISEKLEALIRAVYQGPLEETPWLTFLNLFREEVNANFATLILRPPREGDSGLVLNAVVTSPDVYNAYNETYFALDPFVGLPPGKVVTTHEFNQTEDRLKTEYYQQYMASANVFYIMGVDLAGPDGPIARLRVSRPDEGGGDFGDSEKQLCELLLPHLQQSILLHSRIMRTESERSFYEGAIDQLAMGTIILDENARVLRTNNAAEQLLNEHESLSIENGKLLVGRQRDNQAFRELVEQVLVAHRNSEPGYVKAFRIGQADSMTGLGMVIRPLPLVQSSEGDSNPSAAIFLSDPNQRRVAPADVLAQLFDFTPAESSLALLLANGLTLDEASAELEISRNTAKSHLSAVFSKTGLTRQTKLVQLILKSVAPFGVSDSPS